MMTQSPSLKLRTARTLKWNTIDRVSSQVLYGVVGIVLANVVPKADFGLVGIILVFQAFAILFVDSGFGAALLQKKNPDETDYSTVFWFNLGVSAIIYAGLWVAAPAIAELFHSDERLVPMSRVMFLTFIFTALGIVQTNRLMKRMDVKQIAIANMLAQVLAGALGILLALRGAGAWALVWQSVALAAIKTAWLWFTGRWMPRFIFARKALGRIVKVGGSVFGSSLLNTICLNVYTFIIGILYTLSELGVYTQADKWSKMGSASLSQVFTATFVPLLSGFQDNAERFHAVMGKVNRLSAFLLFPFLGGLIVMAAPVFHLLFGVKWDEAIPLFQILCLRGIFIVLISLYNNYILALGRARLLFIIEVIKDVLSVGAIFATLPFGTVEALVWGQLVSSVVTYVVVLVLASRATAYPLWRFLSDMAPYAMLTAAILCLTPLWTLLITSTPLLLAVEIAGAVTLYCVVLKLVGSVVLKESVNYIFGRFHWRKSAHPNPQKDNSK